MHNKLYRNPFPTFINLINKGFKSYETDIQSFEAYLHSKISELQWKTIILNLYNIGGHFLSMNFMTFFL